MEITKAAQKTREASFKLAALDAKSKNSALSAIAEALRHNASLIVKANQEDLARAGRENLAAPLLKRLKFDELKIEAVCKGIETLITLAEPVGKTLSALELDKGLELFKVSCPIGVIGVIFESRPDALVQIATLCLKSGNAVLLKGGSEAQETNRVLAELIHKASIACGVPENWLYLLETREQVTQMLALDKYIDLIIPRGSNSFVKYIMDNTTIQVLGHADGICHIYVDEYANPEMAVDIIIDSKCQYVAVCNALETLLVHRAQARELLPVLKQALDERQVELRGCSETVKFIQVKQAAEIDWKTEYLDLILSIKIVDTIDQAIRHINNYGSHHTDAIVTDNKIQAALFLNLVDSADVFWNCSTRFSDGFRYGLGAEVGISTNKIHARGPVGIEGLLIYKWKLLGKGQLVADYSGKQARSFTHKKLNKECDV
ncbi:MAG: glutamate-5-semialdehyde dehydrogenase [Spirochaetales bacterium]|nr:glutamate-5-semialdehyde dehydrogenase [Spirochaetales bacterium]